MVGSLADDELVLSDDQDHDTPESAATTEMYSFFYRDNSHLVYDCYLILNRPSDLSKDGSLSDNVETSLHPAVSSGDFKRVLARLRRMSSLEFVVASFNPH